MDILNKISEDYFKLKFDVYKILNFSKLESIETETFNNKLLFFTIENINHQINIKFIETNIVKFIFPNIGNLLIGILINSQIKKITYIFNNKVEKVAIDGIIVSDGIYNFWTISKIPLPIYRFTNEENFLEITR